jgi:hypothetical protein
MIKFKPAALKPNLLGAMAELGATPIPAPPPGPDALYTGYTGAPGALESLAVVAVTAAAAWIGITTALDKSSDQKRKIAGWVGGVGSALFGLLYLGGKTGLNQMAYLPAVRVTPD